MMGMLKESLAYWEQALRETQIRLSHLHPVCPRQCAKCLASNDLAFANFRRWVEFDNHLYELAQCIGMVQDCRRRIREWKLLEAERLEREEVREQLHAMRARRLQETSLLHEMDEEEVPF